MAKYTVLVNQKDPTRVVVVATGGKGEAAQRAAGHVDIEVLEPGAMALAVPAYNAAVDALSASFGARVAPARVDLPAEPPAEPPAVEDPPASEAEAAQKKPARRGKKG